MSSALKDKAKNRSGWRQNPEKVKEDILESAMAVFSESGFAGAKIDEISARTATSKRMIYYYFGDKEGLYARALEAAYTKVRAGERNLDLDDHPPLEALARLVSFTFDHHRQNPDFIRMVMIENVQHAATLKRSKLIRELNLSAIARLEALIARGQAAGVFRDGLDATRLHWQISGLSFFNVSNRPTFSAIYGDQLFDEPGQEVLRNQAVDMILAAVRNDEETP